MSKQLKQRVALPLVRHVLESFNRGAISSEQACLELGVSRSRLFELRRGWLAASLRGEEWAPGCSGGDHHGPWPVALTDFLRAALTTRPPATYAFAASEAV